LDKFDGNISRRNLISAVAAGSLVGVTASAQADPKISQSILPVPPSDISPQKLAKDETFWTQVATFYDRTRGITNLEHGYWGKMAQPVQEAYLSATKMVNAQNSFYARKDYDADYAISVHRVAQALGVYDDEIVLTRNATEAIHNLIRQYQGLKPGDAVLYADIDYPSFKETMKWLEQSQGVRAIELTMPSRANQQQLLQKYIDVFDTNPDIKLMLLTHVSNQHGLVLPVKAISKEAQKRGIDIICDNAQSWGLINYKIEDLDVNWVGFNLHKWIGTPVGVGALYIKRGTLNKIAPYPGEVDVDNTNIETRVHVATTNFAAILAIPNALDFHESIGGANKEARLRYLRSLWTTEALTIDKIEVLGGSDEESWTGMASFRLKGKKTVDDAKKLQQKLENEFSIFTVIRTGLASGSCVRITPQVFNSPREIAQLLQALKQV
jgi:selenocysteine lyase/cysteine desulfurase